MKFNDNLVTLHLISTFDVEPPPDKSVLGRLDKVLRAVGANGKVSVRSRMITAVADTKYRTTNGIPVSLVGLHGKDELLVIGPAWAIERLAHGEQPEKKTNQPASVCDHGAMIRDILESEIFWLIQLPRLLACSVGSEIKSAHVSDAIASIISEYSSVLGQDYLERILKKLSPQEIDAKLSKNIAEEMLCILMRADHKLINKFFESNDPNHYSITKCHEACVALANFDDNFLDDHRIWWAEWTQNPTATRIAMLLPEKAIYLATSANPDKKPTQRKESIHLNWLRLTET